MEIDTSQLFRLDVATRLRLVEALWDSIASSPEELPVLTWQKEELEQRRIAHDKNPGTALAWEQALKELRQRRQ